MCPWGNKQFNAFLYCLLRFALHFYIFALVISNLPQNFFNISLQESVGIHFKVFHCAIHFVKQFNHFLGISCQLASAAKVLPECITNYAAYLKEKHKQLPVFPDHEWPPTFGKEFIRLALIKHERYYWINGEEDDCIRGKMDKILSYKEKIELTEMFKLSPDQCVLKVLVDGAPGIGKTTLCHKICKDWANDKLLHDHHLVVLLCLREKRIAKAEKIEDLFYCDDPILRQSVVQHIQSTSGENVLLIFDAFDELGYEERCQDSLFLDIIKGKKLHKCTVVVTSRPYASETLHQLKSVNRHIEVLGFRQTEIHKCIKDSISDEKEAKKLIDMLNDRLDIVSLCYIPLNCAIMLYVYKKSKFTLPNTLTELFKLFILHAIKRHSEGFSNERDFTSARTASDINNMPQTLKSDFVNLAKFAYNGLMKDNLVFSYHEVDSIVPKGVTIEPHLLGLMTATKSSSSTGREVTYHFLHLTIQEYLAAKWAAVEIMPKEQPAFVKKHLANDRLRMMLLFLAGTTELSSSELFSGETLSFPDEPYYRDQQMQRRFLFLCHITYEAQSSSLCHSLANSIKDKKISLSGHGLTLFDYRVLGYFLANSDCHFKCLTISGEILPEHFEALKHGALMGKSSGITKIECVNLTDTRNSYQLVSRLPTVPLLKDCETLLLRRPSHRFSHDTDFNDGMLDALTKMQCLQQFSIKGRVESFGWQGVKASEYPVDGVLAALNKVPTLRTLEIEQLSIICFRKDTCSCLKGMMSRLTALRMIECDGFETLANGIAEGLTCTTSLVELEITNNCLEFVDTSEMHINLFRAMKTNSTVKKLDVSNVGCREGTSTFIYYAQTQIIGTEVLKAISEMLSCNNTLEELYLYNWNLKGSDPYLSRFRLKCTTQTYPNSSSGQEEKFNFELIASGLVDNHTLLKLGIERCSIEPLKLQVAQLKQTSASKHTGPNPNLHYAEIPLKYFPEIP